MSVIADDERMNPPAKRARSRSQGKAVQWRFPLTWDTAILKAVNKWLDRLPLWQWALVQASAAFIAMAILWAIVRPSHNYYGWDEFTWWVRYSVGFIIVYTGFSTLGRYLRIRRRKRGSTGRAGE